jgi:Asp/Glu/hydantoin racemase
LVFSTFLALSQDEDITSRTPLQDLTVAYWVCMSLAALISLVSVGYKAYEWYEQLRTRIRAARDAGIDTEPTRREALLAKIAAAKKTCTQHIVAFLVAVFEDVPMGTLTVIFTVRIYKIPVAVMLSLVTTCIMLGMKLNKLTLLKYWYAIALSCCAAAADQRAAMSMPRAVGGTRWATGRESSTTTR